MSPSLPKQRQAAPALIELQTPAGAFTPENRTMNERHRVQPEQARYIRNETLPSIAANTVIGIAAAWLAFGAREVVVLIGGPGSLLFDAIPHTFGASVMSALIPSLITRKRRSKGKLSIMPDPERSAILNRLPRNLFLRVLVIGIVSCLVGTALHGLVLPLVGSSTWPFQTVLIFKAGYSVLIALLVTPVAVYAVLNEQPFPQGLSKTDTR